MAEKPWAEKLSAQKTSAGKAPASPKAPESSKVQGKLPVQGTAAAPPEGLVELGRVVSAYGLKGWLKIQPDSAESVLPKIKTWWLECPPGQFRRHVIAHARMHGLSVVAQPEGMDDRTPAEALKGARVWVSRSDFPKPPKDEYYWADLIGCQALDPDGAVLGTVTGLQDHGAHPILEVDSGAAGQPALLIPFVASIVLDVQLATRQIRVDWRADWLD